MLKIYAVKGSARRRSKSIFTVSTSGGFALPNVLALSVVITMFATALLSAMMPIYQRTGALKNANTARAVAEAALDYAIGQLNSSLAVGTINQQFDPGTSAGTSKMTQIDPVATLGFNFTGGITPKVSVRVENLPQIQNTNMAPYANDPGAPFVSQFSSKSILYDPSLTSLSWPSNSYMVKAGTTNVPGNNYPNPYRRVTVTVVLGSVIKNVRVILQPVVTASNNTSTAGAGFPFGLFGTNRVELVGQAATNSYNSPDPRLYGDIGTFGATNEVGTGSVTRGVVEGGYHEEFPNPVAFQTQQIQNTMQTWHAAPVAQAPWCQIMGNVYSNGDITGYWPRAPESGPFGNPSMAQPYNNVFGLPDGTLSNAPDGQGHSVPVTGNGWSGGLSTGYQSYGKPTLPPVPQAASGAVNLGSINIGQNQTLTITPSASGVNLSGNNMQIPPGDYIVNTITISNGGQLNISPAASTSRFFLQGANGGSTAMSVDNTSKINMSGITANTNMNTSGNNGVSGSATSSQLAISPTSQITESSGSANQLQLFYNGTQNIYLLGNERMVIYAPNATINIGSQPINNPANFYGAVVGAVPRVLSDFNSGAGAFFHYDYNLRPQGVQFIDPMTVGTLPVMVSGSTPLITGYRAVTWQEAVVPSSDPTQARWF
jgi:hypothetical protein